MFLRYRKTMHILLIEDDRALADLMRKGLVAERHTVDVVHTGDEGLHLAQSGTQDLIVLDVMLPGMDGLEVTRHLRKWGNGVPIVMLTARDTLHDRLRGFDVGADDYLVKPFAFSELLARIRAVARRAGGLVSDDRLVVGDLVLDRRAHEVTRGGQPIELSNKEYSLLEYLMENAGQVLTRMQILERVWDYGFYSFANVVDVTIARLRKAVDEGSRTPLIHTVRGVGYKLKP